MSCFRDFCFFATVRINRENLGFWRTTCNKITNDREWNDLNEYVPLITTCVKKKTSDRTMLIFLWHFDEFLYRIFALHGAFNTISWLIIMCTQRDIMFLWQFCRIRNKMESIYIFWRHHICQNAVVYSC